MPYTDKDGFSYLADDELADAAAKLGIADPNFNLGSFETMEDVMAITLLSLMGVNIKDFGDYKTMPKGQAREKVRLAWWDSQR